MARDQDLDEYPAERSGINTYNEKSLHAALKQWYALPEDRLEAPVDGYIIDLVRGEQLIEIQTGSFSPLKRKLARLAQNHPVRLVYPVAQEKWIVRLPEEAAAQGEVREGAAGYAANQPVASSAARRKSPKRGRVEQVFKELVYIPALLAIENFSLEVLLIREEEVRRFDAKKAWRRRGWVTQERRLLEVLERQVFQTPGDLARLLPDTLKTPFTVREAARAAGQPAWLVRKMLYCLKALGVVEATGRRGRAILYARAPVEAVSE